MLKKIAIVGAGGLGREVLGILKCINSVKQTWDIVGFYDDGVACHDINGVQVLGGFEELNAVKTRIYIIVAIGNPKIKKGIVDKLSNLNIIFPNIFHPSVVVYDQTYVHFGKGIVIGANAVLTTNIKIGDFVYINTASVVSHDVVVKEYSILMPNVCISSKATIGKKVYLGNSVKIDYPVVIEDESIVPMGTLMTKPKY